MLMLGPACGDEQASNQVFVGSGASIQVIMSHAKFYLNKCLVDTPETRSVAWKKHDGPLSEPNYYHHLPLTHTHNAQLRETCVCATGFPITKCCS
jgi:hypothetical protein